jgi:hypothetical protein
VDGDPDHPASVSPPRQRARKLGRARETTAVDERRPRFSGRVGPTLCSAETAQPRAPYGVQISDFIALIGFPRLQRPVF